MQTVEKCMLFALTQWVSTEWRNICMRYRISWQHKHQPSLHVPWVWPQWTASYFPLNKWTLCLKILPLQREPKRELPFHSGPLIWLSEVACRSVYWFTSGQPTNCQKFHNINLQVFPREQILNISLNFAFNSQHSLNIFLEMSEK